jgi:SAM-dependent methyltransferase
MREHAYVDLHRYEQKHWWYQGMRATYRRLLRRYVPSVHGAVLDLGCGTGSNLDLLSEWGSVTGLDFWHPALTLCSGVQSGLVQGKAQTLPFPDGSFELVAALGVLEHVEDDVSLLREAWRVCQPSGTLLLLTSAFMCLWSGHDEANCHFRRYTAKELRRKSESVGWRVRRLSYANVTLFPLAMAIRLCQRLRSRRREARIDIWPMPEPLNGGLVSLLSLEGWLMRWIEFPLGVSMVAVLERRCKSHSLA